MRESESFKRYIVSKWLRHPEDMTLQRRNFSKLSSLLHRIHFNWRIWELMIQFCLNIKERENEQSFTSY